MNEPQTLLLATPQNASPSVMSLIEMVISRGGDVTQLEKLIDLQAKVQAREAEQAFNAAMSQAQAKMRQVATDANNPQTKSRYASYAALDKALRPIYTQEGFALSFDTGEAAPEIVRALCYVSHHHGHTRVYHLDMPADGKGAKGGDVMTKTHATGAAMSYAMRYLMKMIFNVAVGEYDTDGNSIPGVEMPEDEFQRHIAAIKNAQTAEELVQAFNRCYPKAQDRATKDALLNAHNARQAELRGRG